MTREELQLLATEAGAHAEHSQIRPWGGREAARVDFLLRAVAALADHLSQEQTA